MKEAAEITDAGCRIGEQASKDCPYALGDASLRYCLCGSPRYEDPSLPLCPIHRLRVHGTRLRTPRCLGSAHADSLRIRDSTIRTDPDLRKIWLGGGLERLPFRLIIGRPGHVARKNGRLRYGIFGLFVV